MPASVLENSSTATTTGRKMVITRMIDASPEMVFDAWIDPKQIVYWYGPMGFRTTIQSMDVRPGGEWRLVLHGPDGRNYPNRNVYVEVNRPHRLVYRHEPDEASEPVTFETTVTFEARNGMTLLTLTHTFPTAELCAKNIADYGSVEGARETLGRLADYLPIAASRAVGKPTREVVITRVFNAPREVLFRVWTNAEELAKWWGPKVFTNEEVVCDATVGGKWHVTMVGPGGARHPCCGEYLDVVPPALLVFTNDATDDSDNVIIQGLTRVSFEEYEGDKTRLTLTTRASALIEPMVNGLMGMQAGWSQSLDKLFELVAQG